MQKTDWGPETEKTKITHLFQHPCGPGGQCLPDSSQRHNQLAHTKLTLPATGQQQISHQMASSPVWETETE